MAKNTYHYDEKRNRWDTSLYELQADGSKKRIAFHAKTHEELDAKVQAFKDAIKRNTDWAQKRQVTIAEFANFWLESSKPTLKPKTYTNYEMYIRLYIIPYLGTKKVVEIEHQDIQNFLNGIAANGGVAGDKLSRSTLVGIRNIIRICMNYAIVNKYIITNPVLMTKIPTAKAKKEIVVITAPKLKHLLEIAKNGNYMYSSRLSKFQESSARDYLKKVTYHSINLTANTGMRYGEVFGMTWDDIDFEEGNINVVNNMIEASGSVYQTDPKNHQKRKIKLKSNAIQALKDWKLFYDEYAESCNGLFKNEFNLVFPNSCGNFMRESNFRKRIWLKLIKAAGITPKFTFHSLRHTHITLLLLAGVPVADVAARAGHLDPSVTEKIYSHVLKELNDKTVVALENMDF